MAFYQLLPRNVNILLLLLSFFIIVQKLFLNSITWSPLEIHSTPATLPVFSLSLIGLPAPGPWHLPSVTPSWTVLGHGSSQARSFWCWFPPCTPESWPSRTFRCPSLWHPVAVLHLQRRAMPGRALHTKRAFGDQFSECATWASSSFDPRLGGVLAVLASLKPTVDKLRNFTENPTAWTLSLKLVYWWLNVSDSIRSFLFARILHPCPGCY